MAIGLFYPYKSFQIESASNKLKADIRTCQALAMCENRDYVMVFEPDKSRYTVYLLDDGSYINVKPPLKNVAPYRINYASGGYRRIKLGNVRHVKPHISEFYKGTPVKDTD